MIVTDFHGAAAAEQAEAAVRARHAARLGAAVDALVVRQVVAGQPLRRILVELGAADSVSDAARKMQQGGVRLDDEVVQDFAVVLPAGRFKLQVGKRFIVAVESVDAPVPPPEGDASAV